MCNCSRLSQLKSGVVEGGTQRRQLPDGSFRRSAAPGGSRSGLRFAGRLFLSFAFTQNDNQIGRPTRETLTDAVRQEDFGVIADSSR
jgi:hypothetical protein